MARTVQQSNLITSVIESVRKGEHRNFCVRARAGTGKSTTMVELVDDYTNAFPDHQITLCAFGKAASVDLAGKLTAHGHQDWKKVQASTIHSMGYGLVRFVFKSKVNNGKVRDLIKFQNAAIFTEHAAIIAKLVGLAKIEGFGFFNDAQIGDIGAWYRIADHYDVNGFDDTSELDQVIEASQFIYKASLAQTDVVDFDDMILFPLVKNIRVKFQRDLLIVDEAQDTGRARQALLRKFVRESGITIVVGDDRQAIMGFAGAQSDALEQLIGGLNATVLPLTICWRCPQAVIREAQTLVPDIEAAPTAIEGEVLHLEAFPEAMEKSDAILCRNTAPLIEQAYALLRRGVACKVEGREIGQNLLLLVNRWKKETTIAAWLNRLNEYEAREVQKATAKGNEAKVEEVKDRCETLRHLANVCIERKTVSLDDLRDFINDIFSDDVKAQGMLTLCTYHRAKGREWKRVFLFEHKKRCPSKYAKQAWQKAQEVNLAYVAITRAEETLAYVN